MEEWRQTWREGFAPLLSAAGLRALAEGLRSDDPCLIQGETTESPTPGFDDGAPIRRACAVAYAAWRGDGLATTGEVTRYFDWLCGVADRRLREPARYRLFLNWFDGTPRADMRCMLLPEVEGELTRREASAAE